MAKFDVVGFDEVEKAFLNASENATRAIPLMLEAGAKILIQAQKEEIAAMDIIDKGELMRSIKATKVKNDGVSAVIYVYPQGKDKNGVRNAYKGFVAEYGRSEEKSRKNSKKEIKAGTITTQPARPWMRTANAKCEDAVHAAMGKVWEDVNNDG